MRKCVGCGEMKPKKELMRILKTFLIWGLLLAMPISRMIQGAHYLSDTAVGFMITYTMYLVYRYWFRKRGYL